jgi:hypothetical protein
MPELLEAVASLPCRRPARLLRSVRPSLLDLRFTGDPCVVAHADGSASLLLNNFRLARILLGPFDVPSFNRTLLLLRQWHARRQALRRT